MLLFTSLFANGGGFAPPAGDQEFTTYGDGDGALGAGASTREWAGANMMAQAYVVPVAGKVVSVSAWVNSQSANMRMALYASTAGVPGALLAQAPGRAVTGDGGAWEEFEFDPADYVDVLEATAYWICVQTSADIFSNNAGTPVASVARRIKAQSYASGLLDPFGSASGYSANRPLRMKIWTNPP
jgi:hypothetical protein